MEVNPHLSRGSPTNLLFPASVWIQPILDYALLVGFTINKYLCISELAQFKPMLLKNQLYIYRETKKMREKERKIKLIWQNAKNL